MPDATNPYSFANEYVKAGWLGPLPLPAGKKHPPPTGFTGSKSAAHPTDEDVTNWLKTKSNLALRLAEVPQEFLPDNMPVVYGGNIVDGWELMALDIDTYDSKSGASTLDELESELGELPMTVCNSARWNSGSGSYHAIFFVPKDYNWPGSAGKSIDIIQKRHRYLVAPPSLHPDGMPYEWRYGKRSGKWQKFQVDGGFAVPPLKYISVLPVEWFKHLTAGAKASAENVANMDNSEAVEWAVDNMRSVDEPCDMVRWVVAEELYKLSQTDDHHNSLTNAHMRITHFGVEGHAGWKWAINEYTDRWVDKCNEDERAVDNGEIVRSYRDAINKDKSRLDSGLPSDPCDLRYDVANWHPVDEEVSASDYGGLGNIVGPIELFDTKPPDGYDQNDRGNAQHFIDLYGDNIKYVEARKSWVLWSNGRWHRDQEDKQVTLAFSRVEDRQKHFARQLPRGDKSAIAKAEAWRKWGLKSGNAGQVANALKLAKTRPGVAMSGREFDANPTLMGCENGILVLDPEPYLRPPVKEDYVTYNTKIPYVPWNAEAAHEAGLTESYQLWQEYLEIFQPDPEMRHFIQKVLGHCLIGENPEKLIIFVYGEHDTGKSTLLGGLSGALGDYYGTIDINLFRQKDLNPQLIRAVPLRVTGMSEIDAGRMDASTMKRLTGNDKVVAEAKYSNDIFEGRPQFTTLIACNNEPDIQHADEALRERVLILPFETPIDRSQRRYDRQSDIEKYSGVAVLSWVVEGWKMYCREGLKRSTWPARVRQLCGEVVSHFNSTQQFIAECLDKADDTTDGQYAKASARRRANGKGKTVPTASDWDAAWTPTAARVYELYCRWCSTNGVPAVSHPQLSKELSLGKPQNRNMDGKTTRCYVGVKLRTD